MWLSYRLWAVCRVTQRAQLCRIIVGELRCCMQDANVTFYLKPVLHLCHVMTREEPEGSVSRACVVGVLLGSVSVAARLLPLLAAGAEPRDMLSWLDDAVMQLATAVESWEGARESVQEHVLQLDILLTWLQAFNSTKGTGAPRGVLQLASCMLAPFARGSGGEAAAAAAGGSSGQEAAASAGAGDGAAATEGRPAADSVLAMQVMHAPVARCVGRLGVHARDAVVALGCCGCTRRKMPPPD
jgi:hypothetical protein